MIPEKNFTIEQRLMFLVYRWYMIALDALFGYPKEYTWFPKGPDIQIRHKDGIWTLRPAATYCRRALSPIKTEHRRGWYVVDAPETMKRHIGQMNLSENPGEAITNRLHVEKYLRERFNV